MIGSACLGCIVGLHELVRRTDHRGLKARLPARPLDSHPHRGIGNLPEVPSYQNIDSVREGNGNVGGGVRRRARDGLHVNQAFGGFGRVDNGDPSRQTAIFNLNPMVRCPSGLRDRAHIHGFGA